MPEASRPPCPVVSKEGHTCEKSKHNKGRHRRHGAGLVVYSWSSSTSAVRSDWEYEDHSDAHFQLFGDSR